MKIKKILSVLLTLCLFVNVSFAFDPYADEEVEQKSYKKLYYGIALTLLGGFLAYDGFSLEKVDVSKPSVDFTTVSHSEYVQISGDGADAVYQVRSGISLNNVSGLDYTVSDYTKYEILKEGAEGYIEGSTPYKKENYDQYTIEPNLLYNNGNVDLTNIKIEVRYRYDNGTYIGDNDGTPVTTGGYHIAETKMSQSTKEKDSAGNEVIIEPVADAKYENITLAKGEKIEWQDIWDYKACGNNTANGSDRNANMKYHQDSSGKWFYNDGTTGLNLGKESTILMEVRVILNKNQQYKPIYETKHKSDLEGVAGMFIGIAGIYFIIDHFFDMHKFNAYAKRHHLNLKVATASNQYKLLLQKRI